MPKWNSQRIVRNKRIPCSGFSAINFFGIIFLRGDSVACDRLLHHEYIHTLQIKETLGLFYIIYGVEYIIKGFIYGFSRAYREVSFEKEAYANDRDLDYTTHRKNFSWLKYL